MNNEQEIKQMIFVIDDELDNIEISLDRCIESLEFCDDDDHYQYIETISWLNDLNSKKQSLLNKRAGLKNQIITKIGNENVK